MRIAFASHLTQENEPLVVFSFEQELTKGAKDVDKHLSGALTRALKTSRYKGKVGQTLDLRTPVGMDASRVILVGLGARGKFSSLEAQKAGGAVYTSLCATLDTSAQVYLDDIIDDDVVHVAKTLDEGATATLKEEEIAAHMGYGAKLRAWRCDQFKTKQKAEELPQLKTLTFITKQEKASQALYDPLCAVEEGVALARDVVTLPPNLLFPLSYAERIAKELSPLGVEVQILEQSTITKMGMGALVGVGQGSSHESCVVVMQWKGAENKTPISFVGKGVTFDTGGISIKPAQNMDEMKYDMAGSAAVVGLMRALAGRKAKVNAVGVVGLVENMPSGNAQRPGDIVTTMSGQTVEVLNTDAEGRLVLADVLWYTKERFNPEIMVNLATLTGAIVIALGDQFAGLFSNNDALCDKLVASGKKTGEKLWRLPLDEAYDKDIDSPIADMQNISGGRKAGSITAAQFLQRFVGDTHWAHLDIAGVAWADKDGPLWAKGATGYGVRLLEDMVRTHFEK